jgi:outer membrane receptor protein involved in Fe transport
LRLSRRISVKCALKYGGRVGKKYLLCLSVLAAFFFITLDNVFAAATLPRAGVEELLFEEIPVVALGTLTEKDARRAPVSTTIITSDMIEITPARNIYDLLEIYVPGTLYETHFDSSHVGVRGFIADRDYRSLLLLNGRVINQKATNGMTTELENWDLNDIERIEVVRGPGSVTYGPGAITCVINIITKNASTSPGNKAGIAYVSKYNSIGGYASVGKVSKDKDTAVYSYLSYRDTEGLSKPKIYYMDPRIAGSGTLVGRGIYSQYESASYYNDAADEPQIKFHNQIDFLKEYSLYLRYTNSGTSRIRSWTEYEDRGSERLHVGKYSIDGELVNGSETRNRQVYIGLENNHSLPNDCTLKSLLSFDSIDGERRQFDNNWTNILSGNGSTDPWNPNNLAWNYSESHLQLKSTLNFDFLGKHPMALGAEYSYENYGPGWGDKPEDAVIYDGSVIYCDANPVALQHPYFYGNSSYTRSGGFNLFNYALLAELNYKLSDAASILFSNRLDKNRFSRSLYSPRIAGIYDAEKWGIYKLIFQQSVRMPGPVNLYLTGRTGGKGDPEVLKGIEFNYEKSINNFDFTYALFQNQLNAMGWDSTAQESKIQGRLKTWGNEFEVAYKTEKNIMGFNYAYAKMIDWELNDPGAASGISYHDYTQGWTMPAGMTLTGTGDDLANWPRSMAKFFAITKLNKKVSLFFDCRALWDYAGENAWMEMWEKAAQGTASETLVNNNIDRLKKSDLYKIDFRADISLKYQFNERLSSNVFVMNFLPVTGNYRYQEAWQTIVAIKEPTVFGFRVDIKY